MTGFSDLLLPFGERVADGRMVSPNEVDNGLACGCVCPKCRRRLIAKHSDIVRYHFAHESDSVCVGAFETSAHLLAKQIIADEGRVFMPEVVADYRTERRPVMDARWVRFDSVALEVWVDGLRPDIIARRRDRTLAIEIYVSHRCEAQKISTFRQRNASALEIDLSAYRRGEFDPVGFRQAVLRDAPRYWLFNAQGAAMIRQLRQDLDALARQAAIAEAERYRQAEAEKAEAQEREARELDAFVRAIRAEVIRRLGPKTAQLWLSGRHSSCYLRTPVDDLTHMPIDPNLYWDNLYWFIGECMTPGQNAAAQRSSYIERLRKAAREHFGDADRTELWLRSAHPKLGMKRPLDIGGDPAGIACCLKLLPKRR
jgi:hypothetical protein